MIEARPGSNCAAVFTRNAFCAAPVVVAKQNLPSNPRWLLVNAGNANAGTGERGLEAARETCRRLAEAVNGRPEQVLPFSTGVIGEYLPVPAILDALPRLTANLEEDGWSRAAEAIMTTDTRPKWASRRLMIEGRWVHLTGIAKGSGMIHPDMATMLAFIATDAEVDSALLQAVLHRASHGSFNAITVDGDTSTNDACVLLATGLSARIEPATQALVDFEAALGDLCGDLAEAIVRDGEGATKLIRIDVVSARDEEEALRVAKTIAHSPLVKTAFFASDPNWGRILAAVGRAGCKDLTLGGVHIWLDEVQIVEAGERCGRYEESQGVRVMAQPEITIRVALSRGPAQGRVLTCDFSYDYVRINAEYRS